MDSEKTGHVIAEGRCQLGMTQKQLAEKLHISDRTVSRWERGVGFPDLSLLEPLADTLGLSVVELLRGERIVPAEQLVQKSERSVREFFRAQAQKLRLFRRLLIALGILLLVAVTALLLLWLNPTKCFFHSGEIITASEALDICPFAVITTEEYGLAKKILEDEEIVRYFPGKVNESHLIKAEDIYSIPKGTAAQYMDQIHIEGNAVDDLEVSVIYANISIVYRSGENCCCLELLYNGVIRKTSWRLDGAGSVAITIVNEDNTSFCMYRESRDLLAPLRELG